MVVVLDQQIWQWVELPKFYLENYSYSDRIETDSKFDQVLAELESDRQKTKAVISKDCSERNGRF
jgi:hypothetical protein